MVDEKVFEMVDELAVKKDARSAASMAETWVGNWEF